MTYFLWATAIAAGIFRKRSRWVYIFQILVYWLLIGFNTMNADYRSYAYAYRISGYPQNFIEGGWELLCSVFKNAEVDYQIFVAAVTLVCLLLTAKIICMFTPDYALCMSFYLLYPMSENAIQLKTLAAGVFVLYGLKYLFTDNKRDLIKYVFCILLGLSFHAMAVYYLIFLLVPFIKNRSFTTIASFSLVLTAAVYIGIPVLMPAFLGAQTAGLYLSWELEPWKKAAMAIWQICGIMLVCFVFYQNRKVFADLSGKTAAAEGGLILKNPNRVVLINLLMIPACAMYSITMVNMRLYRSLFLVNYAFFTFCLPRSVRQKKTYLQWLLLLLGILYLGLTVWWFYIRTPEFRVTYFQQIFENNLILEMLK